MSLLEPSAKAIKSILVELNESGDNKLASNVAHIKDWLSCQEHLPQNYDERLVPNFLRGCKHDLERTKRKLDMYYSVRASTPELFSQRNPLSLGLQQASRVLKVCPLPQLTADGSRITVHKLLPHEISQFNTTNLFKYVLMVGDIRLVEEALIAGDVFIFDVAHVTASHLTKLAVPLLRKILLCAQEAYPQRLKEIHILNASSFVDKLVMLFKSFMKEKMRNRFHVHTSAESLQKFVGLDVLPADYGGNGQSVESIGDQWSKKLESYKEWFEQEENVKADESLRLYKTGKNNQELFGFEGTFRTLSID